MTLLVIDKPRGFALKAVSGFYAGFVPGSGMAAAATDHLTLAFRLDETFSAVAVALHEDRDSLVGEYVGTTDEGALRKQLSRMLGLDADADGWWAVGRRDVVVGRLQAEFPGFLTAAKPSPYDAAAWGVIAPRMNIRAAAKLKMGLARKYGDAVTLNGCVHHVFPSPQQLLRIEAFPGLPREKLERMKGVAHAAATGALDADRLRAMSQEDALADLQRLRGVGPWTASHILFRGAAVTDGLHTAEPRILDGFASAYGIESPSLSMLERFAESWRPFRTWVCVLLARHLGRVGGWQRPGLAVERASAGRELNKRLAARVHVDRMGGSTR